VIETDISSNLTLAILHLTEVDKLVGTKARYPLCKVSVFEIKDE